MCVVGAKAYMCMILSKVHVHSNKTKRKKKRFVAPAATKESVHKESSVKQQRGGKV